MSIMFAYKMFTKIILFLCLSLNFYCYCLRFKTPKNLLVLTNLNNETINKSSNKEFNEEENTINATIIPKVVSEVITTKSESLNTNLSTKTPEQEFILMKRPDFIPENGSLKEKPTNNLRALKEVTILTTLTTLKTTETNPNTNNVSNNFIDKLTTPQITRTSYEEMGTTVQQNISTNTENILSTKMVTTVDTTTDNKPTTEMLNSTNKKMSPSTEMMINSSTERMSFSTESTSNGNINSFSETMTPFSKMISASTQTISTTNTKFNPKISPPIVDMSIYSNRLSSLFENIENPPEQTKLPHEEINTSFKKSSIFDTINPFSIRFMPSIEGMKTNVEKTTLATTQIPTMTQAFANLKIKSSVKLFETTTDRTLDEIQQKISPINVTKTLEEVFEEMSKNSTNNSTEFNAMLNTTDHVKILPAGPGLPIFMEPPEVKIHDPDEGPLEPFLYPSNDSFSSDLAKTGQEFILVKRPEFIAEKGSLEERYKHLLIDENDINIPSDFDPSFNESETENKSSNTSTTTQKNSMKMNPKLNKPIQSIAPNSYSSYGYPYNQYYSKYQPYLMPYYQNGHLFWSYVYPRYTPNQYFGFPNNESLSKNGVQLINEVTTKGMTESTTNPNNEFEKLLPNSYPKYGAYIAKVAIDDLPSNVVNADEDTLEALGPIEWGTTTSTTTPKSIISEEIKFLINQQNVNEMNRNFKRKVVVRPKKRKFGLKTKLNDTSLLWLNKTSEGKTSFEKKQKKDIQKKEKLTKSEENRRSPLSPRIYADHKSNANFDTFKNNERFHKRVHRIHLKPNHKNQRQKPNVQQKDGKNVTETEPEMKSTTKPKFIRIAKIKDLNNLKADKMTGIKWWHQEQPNYCSEPMYLLDNCVNRKKAKRWSYNPINKKCYLYEDHCYQFKSNSFDTSRECFRKCYREKE